MAVGRTSNIGRYTTHFDQPWTLDSYLAGYEAWKKVLAEKPDPASIIDELKKSALPRGGAGTDRHKWSFAAQCARASIFCAIPRIEPGTCGIATSSASTHAVIEGMAIAPRC
jgi:NADH-quinone oxidoreductase subunit F